MFVFNAKEKDSVSFYISRLSLSRFSEYIKDYDFRGLGNLKESPFITMDNSLPVYFPSGNNEKRYDYGM